MNQYTANTEKARESVRKRVADIVSENAPGFEYVDGYTTQHGTVRIRCMKCGHIETRAYHSLRHKKILGKAVGCEACIETERERLATERERERILAEEEKQEKKQTKQLERINGANQLEFAVCKECGRLFLKIGNRVNCSPECRRRQQNNRKDRRLKGVKSDTGITLTKLFQRDKGRCYLCGGMCNWGDIGEKGAGGSYPSIDHVIPIARGGTHTWANVKLAHRSCNTLKSDALPV